MTTSAETIERTEHWGARNYAPLPVVVAEGEGAWVRDPEGRSYLDMLSAYSALSHGHRHPKILRALTEQAERCTLTSRAFHNDQLGPFLAELCDATGYGMGLPMNTGTEAVETALKLARKWGYESKGVPKHDAEIVVCENNFHGRTITIVSFSSEGPYRDSFGPFTSGFRTIPYGDAGALEEAIGDNTVALLFEPIQGEGGVVMPPDGFIRRARELCDERNVLMMADEIQTGLGRTGRLIACDHEDARPDVLILGKALGGGVLPLSAVLASREIMSLWRPGEHGSTFGGNPLACAVGRAALSTLFEERLTERAAELGARFMERLRAIRSDAVQQVRGRGLLMGVVLDGGPKSGHAMCKRLLEEGILAKEARGNIVRLAPPLVIEQDDLDRAGDAIERVLTTGG